MARPGSLPDPAETRSSPPPPPPADPPAARTGPYAAVPATVPAPPESVAERALRIAIQARTEIGRPPVAATKDPGSGLWMVLDEVRTKLDVIGVDIAAIRAARATRQDWQTWGARVVIGAFLVALVAGSITLAARVRLAPEGSPAGVPAARP